MYVCYNEPNKLHRAFCRCSYNVSCAPDIRNSDSYSGVAFLSWMVSGSSSTSLANPAVLGSNSSSEPVPVYRVFTCSIISHPHPCGVNAEDISALSNGSIIIATQVVLQDWCIQADKFTASLRRTGISLEWVYSSIPSFHKRWRVFYPVLSLKLKSQVMLGCSTS